MANTIDADLLIDTLSNRVITTLGEVLAPLSAFARDFSTDELVQAKAVQVPVVTGGSTVLTNPTSFEAGDSTTSNVAVTVNHYSQPFHITSQQYNQRFRIEMLADKNLQVLANKIKDVAFTPITTTNFSTTAIDVAQGSLAVANLKTAWANIAHCSQKNIMLDSTAFAQFLPSDLNSFKPGSGAYGFDGFHLNTRWNGAGATIYGFACGPEAIAMAAGIPMQAPGVAEEMLGQSVVSIPGLGLSVQMNLWVSKASRALWASYDVMFGAAFGGQATAGSIILDTP